LRVEGEEGKRRRGKKRGEEEKANKNTIGS
jgi:hypothetical protein